MHSWTVTRDHNGGGVEGPYGRGDVLLKRRTLADEWGKYVAG
ncbi:hypothetical protein [Sphingomonas sp. LB3N6]